MANEFNQIAQLLDIAYKELTKEGAVDIDTILGCVAEAKQIAEEIK
jgi:hypothetical protein